jgi:nucleotide-binding universal stress UspA family protein
LLAVLLLGVLLWVVLSTVAELANPTPLVSMATTEPEPAAPDPNLPRIDTVTELAAWLDSDNLDGTALLDDLRAWRAARGYPTERTVFGARRPDTEAHPYADLDDAALLIIAGRGDVTALQLLAERSLASNPVESLEWYDQAIVNGSVYAMLRLSDLLATLGDPALDEFASDPVWQQGLAEIRTMTPPPGERALAWAIAAVQVGGYGVIDAAQADRIRALRNRLDPATAQRACETAQTFVLETAAARRAQGGAVFEMDAPDLALSVADAPALLRCDIPVQPLVDLGDCDRAPFVGPAGALWERWLCR